MGDPLIVSFYTPNYRFEHERLWRSLVKFDFDYRIEPIASRGQWIDNVYYRAEFVLAMMEECQRDIVWLDVDAEVLRSPDLFRNFTGDFCAGVFHWPPYENHPNGFEEVLGGTMYFAYNDRVLDLVRLWVRLNTELPRQKRSQIVLQKAIESWSGVWCHLPDEYVYIPRFMPNVTNPVIMHHQASGKYRKPQFEGFGVEEVTSGPE